MFFISDEENLFHDIELEIGSLASRHEENAWTQQREHIDYNDDLEEVERDDVVIHEGDMTRVPTTPKIYSKHHASTNTTWNGRRFSWFGDPSKFKKTVKKVTSTNHVEKINNL